MVEDRFYIIIKNIMKNIVYTLLIILLLTSCWIKKQEVSNNNDKKGELLEMSTLWGWSWIPNNENGKR